MDRSTIGQNAVSVTAMGDLHSRGSAPQQVSAFNRRVAVVKPLLAGLVSGGIAFGLGFGLPVSIGVGLAVSAVMTCGSYLYNSNNKGEVNGSEGSTMVAGDKALSATSVCDSDNESAGSSSDEGYSSSNLTDDEKIELSEFCRDQLKALEESDEKTESASNQARLLVERFKADVDSAAISLKDFEDTLLKRSENIDSTEKEYQSKLAELESRQYTDEKMDLMNAFNKSEELLDQCETDDHFTVAVTSSNLDDNSNSLIEWDDDDVLAKLEKELNDEDQQWQEMFGE